MVSTRSSDYKALSGGGNGVGGGSQSSRWLARVPPPGGKEEEDNDSTPVAFDFMTAMVAKLKSMVSVRATATAMAP